MMRHYRDMAKYPTLEPNGVGSPIIRRSETKSTSPRFARRPTANSCGCRVNHPARKSESGYENTSYVCTERHRSSWLGLGNFGNRLAGAAKTTSVLLDSCRKQQIRATALDRGR